MNTYEINQEVQKAKDVIEAGDKAAREMAEFLVGRLRQVNAPEYYGTRRSTRILASLKRELKNFNSFTGEWK